MENAYIRNLYIRNFKKFESLDISFNSGLNILVGTNNAGKTTILEAIDIVLGERNLPPSRINRSLFNKYTFGSKNKAIILMEIVYPQPYGKDDNEVNFIALLKLGKKSKRSTLPRMLLPRSFDADNILANIETISDGGIYEPNTKKGGQLKSIFLLTEITIDAEFNADIEYKIILNRTFPSGELETSLLIGITGVQRNSIVNYLFLPADRISKRNIFQLEQYGWLGRYLRSFIKENRLLVSLNTDKNALKIDQKYINADIQKLTEQIIGIAGSGVTLNLFNTKDIDSLIDNLKVYIDDGYNDEFVNKGQGLQSASIFALFLSWCKFRSKSIPKNSKVSPLWNTLLVIEEPELHFHPPARSRLMSIIENEFTCNGAQVFITTHDASFTTWKNLEKANLILPDSKSVEDVSIEIKSLTPVERRILRFNSKSIFAKTVILVEGVEEVVLDNINESISMDSFLSNGGLLCRSIGGIRSSDNPQQDVVAGGGKNNIMSNYDFYRRLGIDVICLLDIDVLIDGDSDIRAIYKERLGCDFPEKYSFTQDATSTESYLLNKEWWKKHRNEESLKKVINEYAKAKIFFFPGDFEAIFKADYLSRFVSSEGKLIKEKHAFDTSVELADSNFEIYDEDLTKDYKSVVQNINELLSTVQVLSIEEEQVKPVVSDDELPF